jgi:hypothetical protein
MAAFPMMTLARFHRRLAGRSGCDLAGVLGPWLPRPELAALERSDARRRIFTAPTAFWHFLSQILNPGQSCRETVRGLQASRLKRGRAPISANTGAYCQARGRLPLALLQRFWQQIAAQIPSDHRWLGLRVAVIDGTTLSMPDTPANQKPWPQPASQKPGCGFPIMKVVALFSLATGTAQALASGSLHTAEHSLLTSLWPAFRTQFDVLLGDRNFGSYATFATLHRLGRHGVFRLHAGRRMDWRSGRRLGPNDRLMVWPRPVPLKKTPHVPEELAIRILRFQVPVPGFRTQTIVLATDLIDPLHYPAEDLARLYLLRWRVELFFAHLKTTLHMDVLRCRTPEMIRRELHLHLIAYNLIRGLIVQAATRASLPVDRISFKGACDTLRQFAPHLAGVGDSPPTYHRLYQSLLETLASDQVPWRPGRSEPRAVKRRPKNYHLLNKPRRQMGNLPHRNYPNL